MHIRSLGGVAALAIVIAAVVGFKFYGKSQTDDKYRTEAYSLVSQCDAYREHQGYLIGLCDSAHDAAFDQSYTMGSRRRSAKMDEHTYFTVLFKTMQDRAIADGRNDVAASIARLATEFQEGTVFFKPE